MKTLLEEVEPQGRGGGSFMSGSNSRPDVAAVEGVRDWQGWLAVGCPAPPWAPPASTLKPPPPPQTPPLMHTAPAQVGDFSREEWGRDGAV